MFKYFKYFLLEDKHLTKINIMSQKEDTSDDYWLT